ncbi:hypothetical protein V5E97_06880 [Singulisphaera sp. Ch08]|uniref:Uncharacterized protein n=1 Tax=Singulisphaera sp. Ch08 TaxID=3120278 RepID=A0AAU7CL49_9BACT
MATATLNANATLANLETELASLQAKREEIRAELYAVAGGQPQVDRENQLMRLDRQIDQVRYAMAEIELANEASGQASMGNGEYPIWSCGQAKVVSYADSVEAAIASLFSMPAGTYAIGGDDYSYEVSRAGNRVMVCRIDETECEAA